MLKDSEFKFDYLILYSKANQIFVVSLQKF